MTHHGPWEGLQLGGQRGSLPPGSDRLISSDRLSPIRRSIRPRMSLSLIVSIVASIFSGSGQVWGAGSCDGGAGDEVGASLTTDVQDHDSDLASTVFGDPRH